MSNNHIFLAVICITLLVLLLVSGIIITFFVSGRQRIKQDIELAEAKLAFEKELRQVETEVSEKMMSRFAEELHDNIGQLIASLNIEIQNRKLDHPQLAEELGPTEDYISNISQQLRLLSRTLHHDHISHIGLAAAIQLETERLKSLKRFEVYYEKLPGPSNLERNQELMVFRIFQEIIQNTMKHSDARRIYIFLHNPHPGFELTVRDNGCGFDKELALQPGRASGLRNILKRAGLAGLECSIDTAPGQGCLFVLKKSSALN